MREKERDIKGEVKKQKLLLCSSCCCSNRSAFIAHFYGTLGSVHFGDALLACLPRDAFNSHWLFELPLSIWIQIYMEIFLLMHQLQREKFDWNFPIYITGSAYSNIIIYTGTMIVCNVYSRRA